MVSIGNVTFACEEPDELASFWAAVLDYELEAIPPAFAEALEEAGHDPTDARAISDPSGDGSRLFFKRMPKTPTEHIPIHLDVHVADRTDAVERFADLGAREIETKSFEAGNHREVWTVMKDPEENGFCVAAPGE